MALVVFLAAAPGVEEVAGEFDIGIAAAAAFHVIHKAPEPHQRLLHLLMPVEPLPLARPEVGHPTIGELFRRIVQPFVTTISQRVMIDRGLDEIAGHITFMIAAMGG